MLGELSTTISPDPSPTMERGIKILLREIDLPVGSIATINNVTLDSTENGQVDCSIWRKRIVRMAVKLMAEPITLIVTADDSRGISKPNTNVRKPFKL